MELIWDGHVTTKISRNFIGALSIQPESLIWISGNFQSEWNSFFQKFLKERANSRGIPKFSETFPLKFSFSFKLLPEFLESYIRLNGSHFGHSTVSLIHGNFSR